MTHSPTCSGCSYCNPEEFGMFRGCSDDDPPDPYAAGVAAMRTAAATPESMFAARFAADRLRELDAERDEVDAHIAATPRLTAAELADFEPPDPYAAGIKALKAAR